MLEQNDAQVLVYNACHINLITGVNILRYLLVLVYTHMIIKQ